MCRLLLITFFLSSLLGCKEKKKNIERNFTSVEIETVLKDSLLNVRAVEIIDETVVIATSDGRVQSMKINTSDFKNVSDIDTINKPNYRALASNGKSIFTLSIASPALLYKDGEIVYNEVHEKAFYDAIDFWNDKEGIAIGDPTDDCLSIVITRDGGETWSKLSCDIVPKTKVGEAAFAASDTNISIVGNHTWVATGGKASRILYSSDKGNSWEVFDTPIVQGIATTGMYSIDFYDEFNGFAIGGDYTKPKENNQNKIRTNDGGKTWKVVAKNLSPGYRSCVQYIPNSKTKALVAIGFEGIDYSNDSGNTWKHLSDEGFYTLRFLNDSIAYAGGNGRVSKLKFK